MVHLVFKPAVLVLGDVGQPAGGCLDQLVLDVRCGFVKQFLGLVINFTNKLLRPLYPKARPFLNKKKILQVKRRLSDFLP